MLILHVAVTPYLVIQVEVEVEVEVLKEPHEAPEVIKA